jgi:hypothetical protein
MPPTPPPRLRVTEPAEVAQIVPYLVGFTPEQSLVISAIQDGQVQVTARIDLADVGPAGQIEDLLDRIWTRFPGSAAVAVAYTDDHLSGWDVLSRCDGWLPHGCTTMLIDGDTWHTPDGTTGTIDPRGATAIQASEYGLRHLDRRADLEARFASAPDNEELDKRVGAALASLPRPDETAQIVSLAKTLLERHLPGQATEAPAPIGSEDAIQLAVLSQHPAARDLALLSMNRDNASQHLELWQGVVQASPAYGADMPLYLAGMAAWMTGDGASAAIALERSLNAEPQLSGRHPARLLEGIIDNVLPPSAWDTVRRDIADHAHPEVRSAITEPACDRSRQGWPPATPVAARRAEVSRGKPPRPGIAI